MPLFNRRQDEQLNNTNELLPVQPDGKLPLNFYDIETAHTRPVPFYQATKEVVTADKVRELNGILNDYKAGKANLEQRIVDNEDWWKGRNWDVFRRKNEKPEEIGLV